MTGATATKMLRESGYKGKILGVTGNGLQSDISEFLCAGVNEIYLKPLSPANYLSIFKGMNVCVLKRLLILALLKFICRNCRHLRWKPDKTKQFFTEP